MRATWEVARKEVSQHMRTKRLLIVAPMFLLALVVVTLVFPRFFLANDELGSFSANVGISSQNIVMLFFLSGFFILSGYFYVQLVPILLTADAVCSEWSSRTIFLLLSKPVSRAAFVTGKFLGSVLTVSGLVTVLMVLDYLVLQLVLPGHSDGTDMLRFMGAVGVLCLGAMAFAAISLFFGTLSKSTTLANLLAITAWIIVLPLVGQLGFFVEAGRHGLSGFDAANARWSQYLVPGSSMTVASQVLAPIPDNASGLGLLRVFTGQLTTLDTGIACLALVGQTAVFLALSYWIVQRRNFE